MEVKPAEAGGANRSNPELFPKQKSEYFCGVQRSIKVRSFSAGRWLVL